MKKVTLGSLGKLQVGGTPSRSHDEYFGGDIPWVSTVALGNATVGASEAVSYLTDEGVKNSAAKVVPAESLLIGIRVGVGKCSVTTSPMCTNQDIVSLSDISGEADPLFLKYVVDSYADWFSRTKRGATILGVTSKEVSKLSIPLPSLIEQRRIVSTFSRIESSINRGRELTKTVDELVKSRFSEMFGDCSNYASVSLADACEVFSDGDWIESKDQSDGGIRLIQTGNVGDGVYLDKASRAKSISFETFEGLRCTEVFPGDILISRLPDPVGRCCIVPDNLGRSITAVDCSIVRLASDWDSVFFRWFTLTDKYQAQVKTYLTGTTRQRISRKNLGKVLVPRVPLGDQRAFSCFANQVDKLRFDALSLKGSSLYAVY